MVMEIMSYTSFGNNSLDCSDSFLPYWADIQFCTSCGYAAPKLTKRPKHPEVLNSKDYQSVLRHRWIGEYCKAYLCHAHFMSAEGDLPEAAWAIIKAANTCGNEYWQGAHDYRLKAVELMELTHSKQQRLLPGDGEDYLLKTELLRRCGKFDKALFAAQTGLDMPTITLNIRNLLLYEQKLIEDKDTECHSISEANGVNE